MSSSVDALMGHFPSLDLLLCIKHVHSASPLLCISSLLETNSGMLAFHHDGAPIVAAAGAAGGAVDLNSA